MEEYECTAAYKLKKKFEANSTEEAKEMMKEYLENNIACLDWEIYVE